jgi:hypothetical protein
MKIFDEFGNQIGEIYDNNGADCGIFLLGVFILSVLGIIIALNGLYNMVTGNTNSINKYIPPPTITPTNIPTPVSERTYLACIIQTDETIDIVSPNNQATTTTIPKNTSVSIWGRNNSNTQVCVSVNKQWGWVKINNQIYRRCNNWLVEMSPNGCHP